MANMERFKVVWGHSAIALAETLNMADPHNDYEVRSMTGGPWFDHGADGMLSQTGDSVYVLLELKQ